MPRLSRTALALAVLPLAPAWGADISSDQARTLEDQIKAWIGGMVGPALPLPERPVRLTPDGNHYRVEIPIDLLPSFKGANPLTAEARPLDGGKWAIENIRAPYPYQFTMNLPAPPKPGETGPGPTLPVTYNVSVTSQSGQGTFDPSYATPSTLSVSLQGMDMQANSDAVQQTSHIDRLTATYNLRPVDAGRVDLLTDGAAENYTIDSRTQGAERIRMSMGQIRMSGAMNGISRERAGPAVQAMVQFVSAIIAAMPGKDAPPGQKLDPRTAMVFLQALNNLASGFSFDETIDKLALSYGDFGGTLNQFRIGMGVKSDAGMLQASLDLAGQGVALPDLPLGPMEALIPSRVALRPVVSGIAVADLMRLAQDAADKAPAPPPDHLAALFSHGGIKAGLESFSIDVAGANFSGLGQVLVTSPQQFTGQGTITASNFDLLMQRVMSIPQLAQQGSAVMIVAKGLARTVGDKLVWDITYQGGKILVNNQDVSAMAGGGGGGGGGAPPAPRPRPNTPPPPTPGHPGTTAPRH